MDDILIARQTDSGCKTVVLDGETVDFERQNRRTKSRLEAEETARLKEIQAAEAERFKRQEQEAAAYYQRKHRVQMVFGFVACVAALIAMIHFDLINQLIGECGLAAAAFAFGYFIGK